MNLPFDLPEAELIAKLEEELSRSRFDLCEKVRVICYCSVGYRSSLLADRINSLTGLKKEVEV